jgi:hypothetical protein
MGHRINDASANRYYDSLSSCYLFARRTAGAPLLAYTTPGLFGYACAGKR